MKIEIYVNAVKLGYMLQELKNRQVKAWYAHRYDINPVGLYRGKYICNLWIGRKSAMY